MQLNINQNEKVVELGGGSCPFSMPKCAGGNPNYLNVDFRLAKSPDGKRMVDFTCDFSKYPWAEIGSDEFDVVLSRFCLEHIPYTNTMQWLGEVHRIAKPGARIIIIIPNTEAQLKWTLEHNQGWDGKDLFLSASEKLFGDQRHGEREGDKNPVVDSHKAYFNPAIAIDLFTKTGFEKIAVTPYGERKTDMCVECLKPNPAESPKQSPSLVGEPAVPPQPEVSFATTEDRAKVFDRLYFDGGKLGGGYANNGYADFPAHVLTFNHIMARKPESVLELGAGRGYIVKRLQDAGLKATGLDISEHCQLTKVCEGLEKWDVCNTPWQIKDKEYDLCVSVAFWEHIPEAFVPLVAAEMARTCKRGLHGIDFGSNPDRSDKTKCNLKPKEWWLQHLPPGHEVCEKNELEAGEFPNDTLVGDGKAKVSLGCASTMFHSGWLNTDVLDMSQFANAFRYNFKQIDFRQGLPFNTGQIDLIFSSHSLEHVTYEEGRALLLECRRVIKPTGGMRLLVPNAEFLLEEYHNLSCGKSCLAKYDELNIGCANSLTAAGKLWAMLLEGHHAVYDAETLIKVLEETGWVAKETQFRKSAFPVCEQILKECIEMSYSGASLVVDAVPKVGVI